MKQQLIVTILGANNVGILSEIANCVLESGCNILDSRQAIYGQDFSLTMIVEGTQSGVSRAEVRIPAACHKLDLLSLCKRTKQHCKQNLERLIDVEIAGVDTPGVIQKVTTLLAQFDAVIRAFRQRRFKDEALDSDMIKIKLVTSVPSETDLDLFQREFEALLESISLSGKITENH